MTDQLQEHLNKGMYGTPQLKPDEQRKYLGTFRERVALTMTFAQLNSGKYYDALEQELKKHPDYRMTINGKVDQKQLTKLLTLANNTNVAFTCNTDQSLPNAASDFAVVFADKKQAIHHEIIDIAKLYPEPTVTNEKEKETKKKRFSLKNLFHF